MNTIDFLSAVLPPPGDGFYCVVELTTRKKEHVFVKTIEEMVDAAGKFSGQAKDVYFGTASFKTPASRLATNAQSHRCLFADIDIGPTKPYGNLQHASAGIGAWLALCGIPVPFMVASGHGIHCYWPFTEAVPTALWKPVAEGFKRLCAETELHIDPSVSADAARVLRVPGTRNYKNKDTPKNVWARTEGEVYPFEHYARLLEPYTKKPLVLEVGKDSFLPAGDAPTPIGAPVQMDFYEDDHTQKNFAKIESMGAEGCLQIQAYIQNPTKDGSEPLFRSVMSIAKFCTDGETHAQRLGALHPYDSGKISSKFNSIPAPHRCVTLNTVNPGICKGCKFYGKLSSPIQLGIELKPSIEATVSVAVPASTSVQTQTLPSPPNNFSYGPSGVHLLGVDPSGAPKAIHVADTVFYATASYDRANERYVQFTCVEHGTAKSIVVPLAVASSKEEAIKEFAKHGVMVVTGGDVGFRTYVKATIAEAKRAPPTKMPTNLGWQEDDTFAFDSRVFSASGERLVPMYGFDNINETTGVKGTLDAWRLIVYGITRIERWDILAMMLISFGAPLMKFTGLNGVTFHLCGNNSGRGKTLCQRLASSVWGVPDKFRVAPNTSPLAMVNRLGMLGNLPLMVDEITHKGRAEAEWFPEFLSQMSDGRGKDRMESSANAERRNTTSWSTIALMTSNKHMVDYLTAERSHGSEGEIRRLLEITFDQELKLDDMLKELLFTSLAENYGVAGEAYARWMVKHPDTVREVTKSIYTDVFNAFNATGDERFWIAGCACILAGVRLAGKDYAKVVDIPYGKIAAFLITVVEHMRQEAKSNKRTAIDVLNEFTKRNFGKLVVVNNMIARISGIEIAETMDRKDLCGRVEKTFNSQWIEYFIDEKELKAFCSSLSYGYAEFKRDIANTYPVSYGTKNLLMGTKGPSMRVRCIYLRQNESLVAEIFTDEAANAKNIEEEAHG